MKSLITIALIVASMATADARPHPQGFNGKRFEANKTFGLGLELGEPSGIVGKYFIASDRALDFGLGDVYDYYDYRCLYLYLDYLWHPVSLVSNESFELPLYVGVGGSFWHWEDFRRAAGIYHGDALAARVPVGIS